MPICLYVFNVGIVSCHVSHVIWFCIVFTTDICKVFTVVYFLSYSLTTIYTIYVLCVQENANEPHSVALLIHGRHSNVEINITFLQFCKPDFVGSISRMKTII